MNHEAAITLALTLTSMLLSFLCLRTLTIRDEKEARKPLAHRDMPLLRETWPFIMLVRKVFLNSEVHFQLLSWCRYAKKTFYHLHSLQSISLLILSSFSHSWFSYFLVTFSLWHYELTSWASHLQTCIAVCREWLMHEDQALAYRLQNEECKCAYFILSLVM